MAVRGMQESRANRTVRAAIFVLVAAALALAGFLALKSLFRGASLPGCGSGSGCDAVMGSRWGRLGFIPVAVPGAARYLAIRVTFWFTRMRASPAQQKTAWSVLVVLSMTAIGAVLWFTALQWFVIKQVCV